MPDRARPSWSERMSDGTPYTGRSAGTGRARQDRALDALSVIPAWDLAGERPDALHQESRSDVVPVFAAAASRDVCRPDRRLSASSLEIRRRAFREVDEEAADRAGLDPPATVRRQLRNRSLRFATRRRKPGWLVDDAGISNDAQKV
jgi:hypothetical protein